MSLAARPAVLGARALSCWGCERGRPRICYVTRTRSDIWLVAVSPVAMQLCMGAVCLVVGEPGTSKTAVDLPQQGEALGTHP